MEPWSISSPFASTTGSSEATLTSICPSPPGYMSRARATRAQVHRAVPDEAGRLHGVVLLRVNRHPWPPGPGRILPFCLRWTMRANGLPMGRVQVR